MMGVNVDVDMLAQHVIKAAREELLPRFTRVERSHKADGSVITEADLAMQSRLIRDLSQIWPQYSALAEEMTVDQQRTLLAQPGVGLWCLDPLDGTSNFAAGLPFFAVSLCLIVDSRVELGVVYDPMRDECFSAVRGRGAWLNGRRLGERQPEPPLAKGIGLVDFKRLPRPLAERLVREAPYSSQRSLGSVALDWCWIAAGRAHVYLHGKQQLWDYGAGALILHEAGGFSMTLDGAEAETVSLQARSAVAALNPELYREWTQWLGIAPR